MLNATCTYNGRGYARCSLLGAFLSAGYYAVALGVLDTSPLSTTGTAPVFYFNSSLVSDPAHNYTLVVPNTAHPSALDVVLLSVGLGHPQPGFGALPAPVSLSSSNITVPAGLPLLIGATGVTDVYGNPVTSSTLQALCAAIAGGSSETAALYTWLRAARSFTLEFVAGATSQVANVSFEMGEPVLCARVSPASSFTSAAAVLGGFDLSSLSVNASDPSVVLTVTPPLPPADDGSPLCWTVRARSSGSARSAALLSMPSGGICVRPAPCSVLHSAIQGSGSFGVVAGEPASFTVALRDQWGRASSNTAASTLACQLYFSQQVGGGASGAGQQQQQLITELTVDDVLPPSSAFASWSTAIPGADDVCVSSPGMVIASAGCGVAAVDTSWALLNTTLSTTSAAASAFPPPPRFVVSVAPGDVAARLFTVTFLVSTLTYQRDPGSLSPFMDATLCVTASLAACGSNGSNYSSSTDSRSSNTSISSDSSSACVIGGRSLLIPVVPGPANVSLSRISVPGAAPAFIDAAGFNAHNVCAWSLALVLQLRDSNGNALVSQETGATWRAQFASFDAPLCAPPTVLASYIGWGRYAFVSSSSNSSSDSVLAGSNCGNATRWQLTTEYTTNSSSWQTPTPQRLLLQFAVSSSDTDVWTNGAAPSLALFNSSSPSASGNCTAGLTCTAIFSCADAAAKDLSTPSSTSSPCSWISAPLMSCIVTTPTGVVLPSNGSVCMWVAAVSTASVVFTPYHAGEHVVRLYNGGIAVSVPWLVSVLPGDALASVSEVLVVDSGVPRIGAAGTPLSLFVVLRDAFTNVVKGSARAGLLVYVSAAFAGVDNAPIAAIDVSGLWLEGGVWETVLMITDAGVYAVSVGINGTTEQGAIGRASP